MKQVEIPDILYNTIEEFIEDDAVKREYNYHSVEDFILQAVEDTIQANKDLVLMH